MSSAKRVEEMEDREAIRELPLTVDGERRTGVGFYEDEYLRDGGRWRFRARRVTLLESPF